MAAAAADGDGSGGFFSGAWSRLRAAASGLRSRRDASGGGGGGDDAEKSEAEEEATVRSRMARRAAAARRVGRKLALVSFNLEVLVFVYAIWRARRRNLSWRQPIQALPMLIIPALATLIYAAVVRFTRKLLLKDKKMLERLKEVKQENDFVPVKFDEKQHNSDKKCDLVDAANNLLAAVGSVETSELVKHRQPIINLGDDGGGNMSWGHSNDFEPMYSDGLRHARFSMDETGTTKSNAVGQHINFSPEHVIGDSEDSDCMERTVESQDSGADVEEKDMAHSTVDTSSCLPGSSINHINSSSMEYAECSPPLSSPKSNGGQAEEDAAQIALTGSTLNFSAVAEVFHLGVEEKESSKFCVTEENSMTSISENELLVCPCAVNNVEHCLGTSEFSLCSQETEKVDRAGDICIIKVSSELSFLSSSELDLEGGKDASEKVSCMLKSQESDAVVNTEEEALWGPLVVTTVEEFPANMIEVPAIVNFSVVSPESNYPPSVESLAEENEGSKDEETYDVYIPEQKGQEAFMGRLVDGSFQGSFATSSCSEVAKITEVPGVVKEGMSEPQDEGATNHQKDVSASSGDGGNTTTMIGGDSVSLQLSPEANTFEALQETLSDPFDHNICHSAGIILSSSETSNNEAYSSNSSPYFVYDNMVEGKAPFAVQGICSESKEEMNFAFLDTPILLDEATVEQSWTVNSGHSLFLPDSNRTQSLHDIKPAANFDLEESPDHSINPEIFSLYSRSSSCVSEVYMIETLRGGAIPEQQNDHDFSFIDRNAGNKIIEYVDSTENFMNNAQSSELIPKAKLTGSPNGGKEETAVQEHEVSSNLVNCLKTPDVGNGMGETDNYSSFVPRVDLEGLETGLGFSELQCEIDSTFHRTKVSPKDAKNGGNYLTNTDISNEMPTDALQSAQQVLSKSQDGGVFTLNGTYLSNYEIGNAENYFTADYASDLQNTPGSHRFREHASRESQPQDLLSLKEAFIYTNEVCVDENNSDNAKSSLHPAYANLAEYLGSDQRGTPQQQDETSLSDEDIHMGHQGSTSENHFSISGFQQGPFEANDETSSSIFETLASENISNGLMSSSHTSMKESVRSSQKGFLNPLMETIDTFDKIPGDERVNKSVNEDDPSCEPIAITLAGVDHKSEDLDKDHENNSVDLGAAQIAPALLQKHSVKHYAKDASWRDMAMGMSNDFKAARVAGLRQRKPMFTVSSTTGSSTMSELADVQYTEPVDDDTNPTLLSSTANSQDRSNDMTASMSME
ncbi:hypothetical protein ACP4OV_000015 [Aristida adscensionis]